MKYLLLFLLMACSCKVSTTEGIVYIPMSSYIKREVLKKEYIKTYTDKRRYSCTYSGFCYKLGSGFGWNFNCWGDRINNESHDVYSIVYLYKTKDKDYTGTPIVEEDNRILSIGTCR